jgi:hypothetical protein
MAQVVVVTSEKEASARQHRPQPLVRLCAPASGSSLSISTSACAPISSWGRNGEWSLTSFTWFRALRGSRKRSFATSE